MKILVSLMALLILSAQAAIALPELDFQVPDEQSASQSSPDDIVVDLDPSSPLECVPALLLFRGDALKFASVSIDEGEFTRTISRNCMLTAGEYFAAKEVLSSGEQKVVLSDRGTLVEGEVYLDPYISQRCRSLTVPAGLVAVQSLPNMPKAIKVAGTYVFESLSKSASLRANRLRLASGAVIACKNGVGFSKLVVDETKRFLVVDPAGSELVIASSKCASPAVAHLQPSGDCAYQIKKVVRTLVKGENGEELVPSNGQSKAVEARINTQERMSCQQRREQRQVEESDDILVHSKKNSVARLGTTGTQAVD